jgi:hypothetical protein
MNVIDSWLLQRVSPRNLQEAALAERCIVVNEHDQVVGDARKRDCHRVHPDGKLILHRAFRFEPLDNQKIRFIIVLIDGESDLLYCEERTEKDGV